MQTDPLSALARQVLKINVEHAYESLVPRQTGDAKAKEMLDATPPAGMLAVRPASLEDATLLRSALYLWHDYLEESHKLSQGISSSTASFWHAIMHRRQGDFSNSKYWYARCGEHPMFPVLAAQANPVLNPLPLDKSILKLTLNGWNADAFVDLVESVWQNPRDSRYPVAVSLQQLEWRMLFDHTMRAAGGSGGFAETFKPG